MRGGEFGELESIGIELRGKTNMGYCWFPLRWHPCPVFERELFLGLYCKRVPLICVPSPYIICSLLRDDIYCRAASFSAEFKSENMIGYGEPTLKLKLLFLLCTFKD